MQTKLLAYALAVSSLPFCAHADQTQDSDAVEEVYVTASRRAQPASAMPNTVTIVERERIAEATLINNSLAGVLEQTVPGFGPSLDKMAGRGETLRGRNPLYLIDGVPQHNALRDGQRDGHTIDMDFVERVEVIHGSNAIQGVGATGGVINLVTRTSGSDERWSQDVRLSLTTPDDFDSDGFSEKLSYIGAGQLHDHISVTAGVSYTRYGLFYDGENEVIGLYPTQGDLMDSEARNLFFKTRIKPKDGHTLQIMINDFELERNGDYVAVPGDRDANILTGTERGDPRPLVGDPAKNAVTNVSVDYEVADLNTWRLVAQLYYQDFSGLFEGGEFGGFFRLTPDGPAFLDQSEIQSEKYGSKLLLTRPEMFNANVDLTLGLDISSDTSTQALVQSGREWVPEAELSTTSPFLQVDADLGERITATGGLRYENTRLKVDDYRTIAAAGNTFVSGGEPDFRETLVNIGAVFDLNDALAFYSSYAEGFTMPDIGRVLRGINTPGQDVDSFLDLEPVITDNLEVGLRFTHHRVTAELALYQSDSDLGSRLDLNDNGIFEVRREKTEIEGIDASVRAELTDALVIGGNYAYLDGRFDSDDDGNVDTDLDGLNIAPNRLNLFIEQQLTPRFRGRLDISHLFERNFKGEEIDADDQRAIAFDEPYTLANLNLLYQNTFGDFALGMRNLTDRQYISYFSQVETGQRDDTFFAGQGRTLTFSYKTTF